MRRIAAGLLVSLDGVIESARQRQHRKTDRRAQTKAVAKHRCQWQRDAAEA